ncbi:hypothetical protein PIB30_041447 [Stylosanthes scabra]|uniref:Ubiquitin-like protease family profile domain-containing protein n=1 Tax=Stylosanthes scabra TaxID=79078 RepID=A0ABU6YFD8_9FABA|nr:hypothetical protein [Stylosanthes scabra]
MVSKKEQDIDHSPRSQIISSVLVSIRRDHQTLGSPSFDLGVEPPLLTPQAMDAIDEIDDKLKKNPELLRTPDPLGTDDIIADMERRVAVWGTIPKGDNEWLPVFRLRGDKHLEALRYQFKSMAPTKYIDIQVVSIMCHLLNRTPGERYQNLIYCVPPEILWRDDKKKKPHEIGELLNIDEYLSFLEKDKLMGRRFLFAPVLFAQHWWFYVLDVEKKHLFVLYSKNVESPTPERTEMGKFAQPNDYDCAIFVMKWMEELDPELGSTTYHHGTQEKIVSNILLSPENLMRMDVVTEVNEIHLIRPGAALRSPFTQLDSADLKSD